MPEPIRKSPWASWPKGFLSRPGDSTVAQPLTWMLAPFSKRERKDTFLIDLDFHRGIQIPTGVGLHDPLHDRVQFKIVRLDSEQVSNQLG